MAFYAADAWALQKLRYIEKFCKWRLHSMEVWLYLIKKGWQKRIDMVTICYDKNKRAFWYYESTI